MRTLGLDWLLMFMEEHLHSSTVAAALWILTVLLSNAAVLHRFKEGACGGGWLDHTDSVLTNKIGTVLGECVAPCQVSGVHFRRSRPSLGSRFVRRMDMGWFVTLFIYFSQPRHRAPMSE